MDYDELDYEKITELLNKRDEEERRERLKKKKDYRLIIAYTMSLIALFIMGTVWVILETAAPDRDMMFFRTFFTVHDQHFTVDPSFRHTWNKSLLYVAYVLQLISMGLCLIASTINILHIKPKYGKFRITIFIIGGITLIAFVFFLIRFISILF